MPTNLYINPQSFTNPLRLPGTRLVQTPQGMMSVLVPGLSANQPLNAGLNNPLDKVIELINNPQTWFNVVAVLLGILFIILGAGAIARKSA